MERLFPDREFNEIRTPDKIKEKIFSSDMFRELLKLRKNDIAPAEVPEKLNGISIEDLRQMFRFSALADLEGQNILYAINKSEVDDFLDQWNAADSQVRDLLMEFYKKVQAAIAEVLEERNFIVGTDRRIKKEIYGATNHRGFAVKMCQNAHQFEDPIMIPHHPNFMQTNIFPLKRYNGKQGMMILTEDITGAGRFDKYDLSKLTLEERMQALTQTMHGCIHLHNLGLVHHDVKPHNMFFLPEEDSQPIWILGDPECVVPIGYKYPYFNQGPLIFTTLEYFDHTYYGYGLNNISEASAGIDIFAYGMNILEQHIGDYDLSGFVFDYLEDHINGSIDESLLREAFKDNGIQFNIPEDVLVILLRCLTYYREHRPCLSEVVQILEVEYGLSQPITHIEQTPLTS